MILQLVEKSGKSVLPLLSAMMLPTNSSIDQVVPFTSAIDRLYPSEAYVTLNKKRGKAMADQLATVSKLRLFRKIGMLSADDMQKVGEAIKIQLDLK